MTEGEVLEVAAFALDVAAEAGDLIRSTRPATVSTKTGAADLVTDVDLAVERAVRHRIGARYPAHAVDGEELGSPGRPAEHTWYLDPIDGTTNYANGLPWCSFSLALADPDGALVGVVADPFRRETVSAARGRGARLNGGPLPPPSVSGVAGTTVLMELEGHTPWPGMFDTIDRIAAASGTVRIMGSSALALVAVATGRASAAVVGRSHPVDDMAGLLIAREAGAVVLDPPGSSPGLGVAAPGAAAELRELWTAP